MTLPNKLKLYFDGSCTKNPGGISGFSWRLLDENNVELAEDHGEVCRGPSATNNIGEWHAVMAGLKYLEKQKWSGDLQILGDSQLVICQLTGEYRVKKETLLPYHQESKRILKNMVWLATWIPREKNEECDKRSKVCEIL
jgi:ribonuclease HI